MSELKRSDLTGEAWREYEFDGRAEPYRITAPRELLQRDDGTTHRVVDAAGVVHCVPAPGHRGCVLRWQPRDEGDPVQF